LLERKKLIIVSQFDFKRLFKRWNKHICVGIEGSIGIGFFMGMCFFYRFRAEKLKIGIDHQ